MLSIDMNQELNETSHLHSHSEAEKRIEHAIGSGTEKTLEKIRSITGNIRECSFIIRETTKTIRESGVIPELSGAIREIVFAVRDVAKDLRQSADETGNAVGEARQAVLSTINTIRDTAVHARHQMKQSQH